MQAIEKIMLRHLLNAARAHGFKPVSVDVDADELVKVADDVATVEAVDAVDDSLIYFMRVDGKNNTLEWVRFVGGNGADCLVDSSCGAQDWDAVNATCYKFWDKGPETIVGEYITELENECARLRAERNSQ